MISGLQVLNITDPTTPTFAGNYTTPSYAQSIVVAGDYAYVADVDSGLQVINITDPTSPTSAGSYDTPNIAYDVFVEGDYAYVADFTSGLQVINIADPTDPTIAGFYNTPGSAFGVVVTGDYAYVAASSSGLQVLNITDPTTPTLAGSYKTPFSAWGVAVSGDYAYVADYGSGLQVIEKSWNICRQFNTVGSAQSPIVVTNPTNTAINNFTLTSTATVPANTYINYFISIDGGSNWEQITPNVEHTIIHSDTQLKWRVELNTSVPFTPRLFSLTINYNYLLKTQGLTLPSDGDVISNNIPIFTWDFVTFASSYRFQLDNSSSFNSSNLIEIEQFTTTYTPGAALADGVWYWRISVKDFTGDEGPFSMYSSFTIDTSTPIIDNPADVVYEEGSTGNNIAWTPTENNPDNYIITRNGTEIRNNNWDGNSIVLNVDGLSNGTYTYICTVSDQAGLNTSDTVIVTVGTSSSTTITTTTDSRKSPGFELLLILITVGFYVYKRRKYNK